MYDWFPATWPLFVKRGIAAHHYPDGWTNAPNNLKRFREMRQGDIVVAAFKAHRFAGYGTLKSDFYQGGPSLKSRAEDVPYPFAERFDCDWTVIPPKRDPPYVTCHDLKADGFKIDLERGRGAKQIDKATFAAIRQELDAAGAARSKRDRRSHVGGLGR